MGVKKIALGTRTLLDVSGVEAQQSDVLANVPYVNSDGELVNGTMPNNGAISETISTKTGTVTVPQGYHDGKGTVGISSTEQSKIVAGNIKSGVKILGVSGSYKGDLIEISGEINPSSGKLVISNSAIKSTSSIVSGMVQYHSAYPPSSSLHISYAYLPGGLAWLSSTPNTLSMWNMGSYTASITSGKITLSGSSSYSFGATTYKYTIIIKP